jgi:7-dehydrocholesterol reductase
MAMTLFPYTLFYILTLTSPKEITYIKFDTKLIYIMLSFIVYAYLSIIIGLKTHNYKGLKNIDGVEPEYAGNGFHFWLTTVVGFLMISYLYPSLYVYLYSNFINLAFHLLLFGYLFCVYLYFEGISDTNSFYVEEQKAEEKAYKNALGNSFISPELALLIFRYYRGMKLHATILGVQVKQLINCRIGMMLWQLLILVFYQYSIHHRKDHNNTLVVNVALQTLYIGKFFHWEKGYFNTLDMTHDRAGFYIIWGCLFLVPSLYTSSTFFIATHPYNTNNIIALIMFILGLVFLYLNYYIDQQKFLFQLDKEKDSKHLTTESVAFKGTTFKIIENGRWRWLEGPRGDGTIARLLLSHFWQTGRHVNYTFELLLATTWTGVAFFTSLKIIYLGCFAYTLFILILLIHRTIRDDKKCSEKYGNMWRLYKKLVPTNFFPCVV